MRKEIIIRKFVTFCNSPQIILKKIWMLFEPIISDKLFLKVYFRLRVGYWPDLRNPKSFNEKLQWLKLNDIHSEYTKMVDKIEAKKYVASIIGDKYIIPTLGTWNSVDEIDWDSLPNQFVIKVTSDSGGIVVCNDKMKLDIEEAKAKLLHGWGKNYYKFNKEYPYKDVKPRIIAEQYMEDESGWQLKDYKIFCFNGEPHFIEVDYDRYVAHKLNVYDLDWNFIDFYMTSPNDKNVKIEKPKKLDLMLQLAKKLSHNIPFLRVDFYSINSNIYFGELTFFPGSGMIDFHPKEYDKIVGEMLKLSNK